MAGLPRFGIVRATLASLLAVLRRPEPPVAPRVAAGPVVRRKTYTEYGAKVRYTTPLQHDEAKAEQAAKDAAKRERLRRALNAQASRPKPQPADNVVTMDERRRAK